MLLLHCFGRSPVHDYVEIPHVTGYPILSDPQMIHEKIVTPGCNNSSSELQSSYISVAPPEVCINSLG